MNTSGLTKKRWLALACGGAVLLGVTWAVWNFRWGRLASSASDPRLAQIVDGVYEDVIRRSGTLQAISQERIIPRVRGTILKIVNDGVRVEKGAVLLELDSRPHEEALARQVASLRRMRAEREKDKQAAAKEKRRAQVDGESRTLRADLETLRLKELELGPSANEEIDALNRLEAAKNLFQARKEECEILEGLARDGFVAQSEVRQKALEMNEQALNVLKADIAYRKLHTLDPVKLAEQRLKLRDELKNRDAAQERVKLLEKNNQQAEERFAVRLKREELRRVELEQNITKTRIEAPIPGVALIGKSWGFGFGFGPGQEVYEGREVLTLSDLRTMKAVLSVDEGRIAKVAKGQKAVVRPVGLGSRVFKGTVIKVAEKGRDEFEDYLQQTKDLSGRANRQVFEVEVEIEGLSSVLRPGLRVEVDIVVQRIEHALLVPRSAVVRERGAEAYIRLDTGSFLGSERKAVKVLADNELACAVEGEGLQAGTRVWLVEP